MSFVGSDVFGDGPWRWNPGAGGNFAEMIVLRRAEEGTQTHRELVAVAVVIGDRLGADFVLSAIKDDGADDLGGVEQGVNHAA